MKWRAFASAMAIVLAATGAVADSNDDIDRTLAGPASRLEYGMLRLERALEDDLSRASNRMVIPGNFGSRDHRVRVDLAKDGRTILIRPTIVALEYFTYDQCLEVLTAIRSALRQQPTEGGTISVAGYFADPAKLGPEAFSRFEHALFARMAILVRLVSTQTFSGGGSEIVCGESLVP